MRLQRDIQRGQSAIVVCGNGHARPGDWRCAGGSTIPRRQ